MNSKMELSFQKKNIGIGRRKQATARVFLFQEKEILRSIIS
jgi:ribosomal protein S9